MGAVTVRFDATLIVVSSVFVLCTAGATVLLAITNHPDDIAVLLAGILALVPVVFAQLHVANRVDDARQAVDDLADTGTETAVRRVIADTVTPTLDAITEPTNGGAHAAPTSDRPAGQ